MPAALAVDFTASCAVAIPQMGDEGLERFSYYPIKDEVLDKSAEQVVANPTLSETVALLIDRWSRITPRQKAWLSILLQPEMENWDH